MMAALTATYSSPVAACVDLARTAAPARKQITSGTTVPKNRAIQTNMPSRLSANSSTGRSKPPTVTLPAAITTASQTRRTDRTVAYTAIALPRKRVGIFSAFR